MEHTENIIKIKLRIITSLLTVFEIFELHLIGDTEKLGVIAIGVSIIKKKQVYI